MSDEKPKKKWEIPTPERLALSKERVEANKGQFAWDRELASKAGKKGAAKTAAIKRAKRAFREAMADKEEFVANAAAIVTEENPVWMTNFIRLLMNTMEDPNASLRERMDAGNQLTQMLGTQAAKRTEAKVKTEEMSPEEAADVLKGLKVIK